MRYPIAWSIATFMVLSLPASAQLRYVGAKACAQCHDAAQQGDAFHRWQTSRHAQAYRTLTTHTESEPRRCQDLELWIVELGRGVKYGLPKPAGESEECLPCHMTAFGADPQLIASSFDPKDGVQCESCHGPGSAHVEARAAKDGGKATAGLRHYEDERAIKALCRNCHEGTCGDFDFARMWPTIKHSAPSAH